MKFVEIVSLAISAFIALCISQLDRVYCCIAFQWFARLFVIYFPMQKIGVFEYQVVRYFAVQVRYNFFVGIKCKTLISNYICYESTMQM